MNKPTHKEDKHMKPIAKNYTFKLDDLAATQLDWLELFAKEIGVPKTNKRSIVARAIELYIEHMEYLVPCYYIRRNHKDILEERAALTKRMIDSPSMFGSSKLPDMGLTEEDVFPTYTDMVTPKVTFQPPNFYDKREQLTARQRRFDSKYRDKEAITENHQQN